LTDFLHRQGRHAVTTFQSPPRQLVLLASACFVLGSTAALLAQDGAGSLRLVEGRFGKALDARATPVTVDGSDHFRTPPLTVECWAKLHSKTSFNVLVACDPKSSGQHWEIYSYAGSGAFSAYLPGMQPAEIRSK